MSARPSLQQVADAAGVARATVSYALRNSPKLRPETIARIRQVAAELGYVPNPLVSVLMSHIRTTTPPEQTTTLAYVTAFASEHGWRKHQAAWQHFEGAARRSAELGFRLDPIWARERDMTGRRLSSILYHRNIHGVIVAPIPRSRGHLTLEWHRFACACLGYSMWKPSLHRAVNHQYHTMRLALRQLRRLGYRRIGLAMPAETDARVDHNWSAGYYVFQAAFPARSRLPPLLWEGKDHHLMRSWIEKHRIDAIVGINSEIPEWLASWGIKVPETVAFANLDWSPRRGEFAGVHQNADVVGAAAIDLVVGQLQRNERGIPAKPRIVLVEGDWRDGASAPPKARAAPRESRLPGKIS
jgi:LacI family transcriptional regulator